MELDHKTTIIPEMIHLARLHAGRKEPFANDLSLIRNEIRQRRKHFLGTHISLQALVRTGSSIDEDKIKELSDFLAIRTLPFWALAEEETDAAVFAEQFYELAIYAISSGNVGDESLDDIIQLAECLIRSRDVFVTVMKNLLPSDMIWKLFVFVESHDASFFSVAFEDAVLGAVSVLVGALADPLAAGAADSLQEG